MKKHIVTKQIESDPMTLGEFIERSGRNPYKNDGYMHENNEPGYLVRYKYEYESWEPKDVFEKTSNVDDTPLGNRMYVEYNELMERHNKLTLFLNQKDAIEIAGENQVALMRVQKAHMYDYLLTLKERIDLMKK